ncbi:urease accessory protein [Cohaesibacter sp. ES.047]|uniref:urease accessory protein UreD n=1 Tax=Cohaesibacter sp. ES.047 TaxID=1798205 RepID=UPI000BB8836D|nr:urease accessory protein UreD [Cohaesibacter sp. ES.047]SNY90894.1 urease accessory protein [Cohaesibacter sp. ES.047]
MYAAISPSDPQTGSIAPSAQRAKGRGQVSFKPAEGGVTRLDRLYQQGCAKIRLPKVYGSKACEAVLINSSGGLTGGDNLSWDISCGPCTKALATTQACEKLYKSTGSNAELSTRIAIADGARFDWLPQETILFDRSRLNRSLQVDLEGSARFLAVEAVLLGRIAMGETNLFTSFNDHWQIRRDGKLIHSDTIRLEGTTEALGGKAATLAGNLSFATLCYVGPDDAESLTRLTNEARELIAAEPDCTGGASCFGGKLLIRLMAPEGMILRRTLIPLISLLRAGEPLPRVWTT